MDEAYEKIVNSYPKDRYFCYNAKGDFIFCQSEEEAKTEAELSLEEARYEAQNMDDDTLWPPNIENVCWGEIKGRVKETVFKDYKLNAIS
jgi:hypothetical protein